MFNLSCEPRALKPLLLLTARAIMTAPSCDDNPLDGGAAYQAWLALSAIHAMSQLKKSLPAFGIDVIVYRRSAQLDRLAQDRLQCDMQFSQLGAGERRRPPAGTNPGAKQRLVSINVSHAA